MTNRSVAQSRTLTTRRSSRLLTTDARFASILAEDFPTLSRAAILKALGGHPQKASIELCAWAEGCEEPEKALTNWARKHS